eukprot:Em0013g197a
MDRFQSIRKVDLHTTDGIPAITTTFAKRKRHSYAGTGGATFGSKEKTKRVHSVGCLEQHNQTSLLQFMAPLERKSLESVTASRIAHNSASAGLSSRDPGSTSRDSTSLFKQDHHVPELLAGRGGSKRRNCPFYKWIPGTGFTVDAFSYGAIPGCKGYFLSHFHSDHYQGLKGSFEHTIYCSKVTANLVAKCLKVRSEYIFPLPFNAPQVIDGVEITLLDANHCPGSAMFLFRLRSGLNYLHTGDFRATRAMQGFPELCDCRINQLFLDTTYCSPEHDFPEQADAISFVVRKTQEALRRNPSTLIISGTYTIGKEKVFLAISETVGSKVYVGKEKMGLMYCLEWEQLVRALTLDPHGARVHVLSIGELTLDNLSSYLEQYRHKYTAVLAFKPTGWTYRSKCSLAAIQAQTRGAVTIYGVPYSEHSSYSELREFVQFISPQKVVPTVGNGSEKNRLKMQQHFALWLTSESHAIARQTTLEDSLFKGLQ